MTTLVEQRKQRRRRKSLLKTWETSCRSWDWKRLWRKQKVTDENYQNQHLVKPGPTQEMTYLGITYNTKEGTIKVGQILCC